MNNKMFTNLKNSFISYLSNSVLKDLNDDMLGKITSPSLFPSYGFVVTLSRSKNNIFIKKRVIPFPKTLQYKILGY